MSRRRRSHRCQHLLVALGAGAALAGLGGVTTASATTTTWREPLLSAAPPPRSDGVMAYDPAVGKLLLFGGRGQNGGALGDTWTWNGRAWAQLHPATSPPARYGAAMAYDTGTRRLVLFGGLASGVDPTRLGDSWTFDGGTWRRASTTGPSPRYAAAMASDPTTGRPLLFGGFGGAGEYGRYRGDTWTWTGSGWLRLRPAHSPAPRLGAAMSADPECGAVVLFGGRSARSVRGDTWTWRRGDWTRRSPASSPSPRVSAALAHDPAVAGLVLFGGLDAANMVSGETWTWDGRTWRRVAVVTSPPRRYDAHLDYDVAAGQLVLFGGSADAQRYDTLGDTWLFDAG